MKKLLFAFFTLCFINLSSGQTLLTSFDLELKKSSTDHKAMTAVNNNNNEVFVFASDKEKLTSIHYNNALFFKDSLSVPAPGKKFQFLTGYSFNKHDNPIIYWATEDYKKIASYSFDYKNKTVATKEYNFPFKDELLLNSFSENNTYYFISLLEKEEKLKFYVFQNDTVIEKKVDFSGFLFANENKKSKLSDVLEAYPLEKMDTQSLNPLFYCTEKVKFYVLGHKMILTFDLASSESQIFEIDLQDFEVQERKITKPNLKEGVGSSNSFYHQGKFYQMKASENEIIFTIKDYVSTEIIGTYNSFKEDTIAYKNSPFLTQTGNQRTKELKNTKNFLNRLDGSEVGISVYKIPEDFLITLGGKRNVASSGNILLGVSLGVAGVISGNSSFLLDDLADNTNMQMLYFETNLDQAFNYKKKEQQLLAVDYISQFLQENENAGLTSTFKFKDYYILGYYDRKEKKYLLRKFQDFF